MRSHVKPQHTLVFCGFIRYTPKRPTDLDNFEFPRWIEKLHARLHVRPSVILVRVFWLVENHEHTCANRSHVKYEFINTKKLAKKLARIEASCICRQQVANVFADCFCAVHTQQLEFADASLQI